MSGLRCVALDSDALALRDLGKLLHENPRVANVSAHTDIHQAATEITHEATDVVFVCLIHHSPDSIQESFKTATDGPLFVAVARDPKHAMEAYQVGAVDYLIKPLTQQAIDNALTRVESLSSQRSQANVRRIIAERDNAMHLIDLRDILYVRSNGDYTTITTTKGEFVSRNSLTSLAEDFEADGLIRVHRQWLVPIKRIEMLKSDCGHTYAVVQDTEVPVARRNVRAVRDLLG
jgi:DNA-binding LytR/AlgR family response regulator